MKIDDICKGNVYLTSICRFAMHIHLYYCTVVQITNLGSFFMSNFSSTFV